MASNGTLCYAFIDIFSSAEFVIYVGSLMSIIQVVFNIGDSIRRKSVGISLR